MKTTQLISLFFGLISTALTEEAVLKIGVTILAMVLGTTVSFFWGRILKKYFDK